VLVAGAQAEGSHPTPFATAARDAFWQLLLSKANLFYSIKNISAAIRNRKWVTIGEILSMTLLTVLSLGMKDTSAFRLLATRMQFLWRKSGKKFLVLYLKECVRIVLGFINSSPVTAQKAGVEVRVSRAGLPTIIPGVLRLAILAFKFEGGYRNTLVLRAVLTILSFYRVINFTARANLETITGPFTGVSPLLDIIELGKVVAWFKVGKLGSLRWSVSESAGPNGPKATWFSGPDCVAFLFNPRKWFEMVVYMLITGNLAALCWFLFIQLATIPMLPIMFALRVKMPTILGRLVALKEGAGKVRIIAITDWWTQLMFRPIHDCLFKTLGEIPQDGTFDQWRPIQNWVLPRLQLGSPSFSFDLSAATDRLPKAYQTQVLTILFGPVIAYFWSALLDRDWLFQGTNVRYAVGQPMGAYSSWAMLAICHHIVVQLAAYRAGWRSWFPYYALLGDDLVIADKAVADHYLSLMRHLGVPINLTKSIVSETGLLEFAKRWVSGTRGELSALGPGLILASVRNNYLFSVLVLTLYQRGFLIFPSQLKDAFSALKSIRPKIRTDLLALMLATVIGPSGLLRNSRHVTAFAEQWFTEITKLPMGSALSYVILGFKALVEQDMTDVAEAGRANLLYFILNWMKTPCLHGPTLVAGILSVPLTMVSPGFWIYGRKCVAGLNADYSASLNLYGIVNPEEAERPGAIVFDLLGLADLASIDWKARPQIKDQFARVVALQKAAARLIDEDRRNNPSLALVPYSPPVMAIATTGP
jgi:hypothetical protein